MSTNEMIEEAASLPVEARSLLAYSILHTLNSPSASVDQQWAEVATKRLQELRSSIVKTIPGDEVFSKVRQRFSS